MSNWPLTFMMGLYGLRPDRKELRRLKDARRQPPPERVIRCDNFRPAPPRMLSFLLSAMHCFDASVGRKQSNMRGVLPPVDEGWWESVRRQADRL